MSMFNTDSEKISRALLVWANHIETGNVSLSAGDMTNMGQKPKAINEDQVSLVAELRELASKALRGQVVVKQ